MIVTKIEQAILQNRLRCPEADAVDDFDGDAVAAVGRPDFLRDDVVVLHAVETDVAVRDAVNVDVEPGVEVAVVAVVVEGVLALLLLGCQAEDAQQGYNQGNISHWFHGFWIL
ncbi:MAG: hypothetical protein IKQ12_10390 [Prevotella sp.]|nr:hypothetical protein [Prevotella sp.]